ncbi:uncharacterized protein LOC115621989 [Scaptodrosophila lebanonensis]|uniref:Uncharacterized protein LOC115621989 n=1 Tax=Drosophila lebanonensis TaxID=7225 RepID=A0A6J2T987_DROLE|nr:uncharacterized protein LOC115621989 [Scaptodrosophila lebanonensis]
MVQSVPPAVQLGSAIVAAVEQDAEEEAEMEQRLQRAWLQSAEQQLWRFINGELSGQELSRSVKAWQDEARGKHHKHKKLLKMLYPLLGAALLAKLVLLPLVLKALTALSSSSFVMGKIALITSSFLVLKWIFSSGHAHDRLEIIHAMAPSLKAHATEDIYASGSSWWPMRQRYIPLGPGAAGKDAAYRYPQHNYEALQLDRPFL